MQKNGEMIRRILFIVLSINILNCNGQNNVEIVEIPQYNFKFPIDSINNVLEKKHFPIKFILGKEKLNDDSVLFYPVILHFLTNNFTIDSIENFEEFAEVYKVTHKRNTYYIIDIFESLIVGYEYFFLIKEKPFECYKSNIFNQQGGEAREIDISTLDFKSNSIVVNYLESNTSEKVFFNTYKTKQQ
jgi:hypothetical protein